jgi:hypothetical protein
MVRARYLVIGVVVVGLLIVAGGIGFVIGQNDDVTDERATSSSVSVDDTGSMMGSSENDEEKPFDLQFIDEMNPAPSDGSHIVGAHDLHFSASRDATAVREHSEEPVRADRADAGVA